MTEKKYMTASEYFRNEIPLRVKIYMDEFNKSKLVLKELDTHFKNVDLLKDKILKILNDRNYIELIKHKWANGDTMEYEVYKNGIKEKILEMLK